LKIYTRTGDNGNTHLLFGEKVSKDDIRCEAYGLLDSVNSHLGMCRAITNTQYISSIILDIQQDIFTICTEVSVSNKNHHKLSKTNWGIKLIDENSIIKLEKIIDSIDKKIKLKPKFIFPGSNIQSAAIDLARTQTRSAERMLANLNKFENIINSNILKYINRLSDLLFYLARIPENEKERKYFESKNEKENS
jgi:cob(I)alamin adenosyltransferase